MAQGFYNAQEACAKLKKTEDELRKLVRDGQLREFRDARGIMYRAQEVDALVAASEPGHDSVAELTLADSSAPAEAPKPAAPAKPTAPAKPAAPAGDTSVFSLDTTASEADAAKTDVFSLEPGSESGEEKKGGSGSGSSISLLDDLENITIPADPMAETVVSADTNLTDVPATGAAGGSGLLDLARESDDTSLGAELYDESAEGSGATPAAAGSSVTSASAVTEAAAAPAPQMEYYVAPAMTDISDPMAPAFVGMSIVGLVALLVAGMAVAAAVIGSWPSLLQMLSANLLFYVLGVVVAAGAAWGIGWWLGKQAESRRYAYSRAGGAHAEAPEAEQEA